MSLLVTCGTQYTVVCNTTEPKNMLGINLVIDTGIYPFRDLQHWWSLSNLIEIAALRNT